MKLFAVIFHYLADQFMQMSSIDLVISEKYDKLKSALSLNLHNSFTGAASDIYMFLLFCYN